MKIKHNIKTVVKTESTKTLTEVNAKRVVFDVENKKVIIGMEHVGRQVIAEGDDFDTLFAKISGDIKTSTETRLAAIKAAEEK